jgi:hypothetical protein
MAGLKLTLDLGRGYSLGPFVAVKDALKIGARKKIKKC